MAAPVTLPARAEEETAAPLVTAVAELKRALADYAREHGGKFTLFGSAARREMRPDSDVDILVDFPASTNSDAISFAESACWKLGLKPDILAFGYPAGRLRDRIDKEGLVLPGDENRWAGAISMEDRLADALDAARSAAEHFRAAGRLLQRGGFDESGDEGYARAMALLHAMLSGHNALEDALVRLMKAAGEVPPSGSDWHLQVIEQAATAKPGRPAVLPPRLVKAADETRRFRHFAARAYRVGFDPDKARKAVEAAQGLADNLEQAVASFLKTIQPD
jgi:predicted nucleotidyltransferase